MDKLITIFTPTYNRAYCLGKVYKSLCQQSNKNFLWLIVDDGSTDNTAELVRKWMQRGEITIAYYCQENGGKQKAHNNAVIRAKSELFFCLDSDDILAKDAIDLIEAKWKCKITNTAGIVSYKRSLDSGMLLSTVFPQVTSSKLNALYQSGFRGETTLVYRVDVLKKHLYPKIPNELYMPDAYVYDRIDRDYSLMILPEVLQICEYLSDGTSANMYKTHKLNPLGYAQYYNQKALFSNKFGNKCSAIVHYVAFSILGGDNDVCKKSHHKGTAAILFPLGVILSIYKKLQYWAFIR